MAKYDPLREHLARLDEVVWAARLDDVEQILGSELPKSAREHRTWWANSGGSLVHQNAWLDAGWKVDRTDLPRNVVVFRRSRIGGTVVAPRMRPANGVGNGANGISSVDEQQLLTAVKSLREPMNVTVRTEWTVVGVVTEQGGKNAGGITDGPGICRLAMMKNGQLRSVVIDARDMSVFHRALVRALFPHGSDEGRSMREKIGLQTGQPVEVDIIRSGNAWLLIEGRGRKADLGKETERELVGRLVSLQERQTGREGRLIRC